MNVRINDKLLNKGWRLYTIMHGESKVASVREDGTCTIYRKKRMPYNLYLEAADEGDIDTRINNLNNFYYWCSSRVLTLDRKYAKEILNSIGAKQAVTDRDRALIAISYHALSLTDIYWVKQNKEKVCFSEISLFRHSLSGAFVDVSLNGKELTLQNSELITRNDVAGDIGTLGVAPKAWIRENDTFYLLKNGDLRDVEAELLASKIVSCFDLDSVIYEECYFGDKKVSKSRIVTSESQSIVSMEAVDIYCVNHDKNRDEFVLEKDAYSYHMMNLVDYLIGNTDRHWGNWGFLVNNSDNKLEKLHPLMDFNKAFNSYDSLEGTVCQTNSKWQTQKDAAIEAVKSVGLNRIKEIKEEWFSDASVKEMFFKRLAIVEKG